MHKTTVPAKIIVSLVHYAHDGRPDHDRGEDCKRNQIPARDLKVDELAQSWQLIVYIFSAHVRQFFRSCYVDKYVQTYPYL